MAVQLSSWGLELDSLKGKVLAFLPDVHDVREDLADYLGEALAWDGMVNGGKPRSGECSYSVSDKSCIGRHTAMKQLPLAILIRISPIQGFVNHLARSTMVKTSTTCWL